MAAIEATIYHCATSGTDGFGSKLQKLAELWPNTRRVSGELGQICPAIWIPVNSDFSPKFCQDMAKYKKVFWGAETGMSYYRDIFYTVKHEQ
jgi:hypothetical protein